MTDNEVIKALECCRNNEREGECKYCLSCPMAHCDLDEDEELNCLDAVYKRALDLINRQKAEIERLKEIANPKCQRCVTNTRRWARAEAIMEFAERLKNCLYNTPSLFTQQRYIVNSEVDTLVEEMTVNYESSKRDVRKDEGK